MVGKVCIAVRGCRVFNNRGVSNKDAHSGNGIVLADVDGALIEFNVAYGNGEKNSFGGGGPVGIWAWDANAVIIQFNESYGNKSGTFDGGGFDLDGGTTNSVMQYNYSHDNDGPGYQIAQFPYARRMDKNTIRYNISENDCRNNESCGAINLWNGGSGINNTLIHNNTVFLTNTNKTISAFRFMTVTNNTHVYNNIFVTTEGAQP